MKVERIKNMRIFQANATEDSDQEVEEEAKTDEDSNEEYVLISALTGLVSPGNDTWLVDSGSSKHMTGYMESLSFLEKKEYPHKVMLGDDFQYAIKGIAEAEIVMTTLNGLPRDWESFILGICSRRKLTKF